MPLSAGYSAGKLALELEGKPAGFLKTVEGGEAFGIVVTQPPGGDGIAKKDIGRVDFEPITITFGVGMGKELYAWVAEVLDRKQTPRDGAIGFLNYDFTEVQRLEWKQGVITAVVFPSLDGASKEAAFLTVTIAAESTTLKPSGGKPQAAFGAKSQKPLLACNFRFSVSGLEAASMKVKSVDGLSVIQPLVDDGQGGRQPGPVHVPNVFVTVAMSSAQPWLDWLDDFLAKVNAGDQGERTGTLELLDPTLKNALLTLTLSNVGPVRARRQLAGGAVDVVAQIEVELYCESMAFSPGKETAGSVVTAQSTSPPPSPTNVNVVASAASLARTPELVAARLKATVRAVTPAAAQRPRRAEGESLGERWATDHASLSELQQIAPLETGEWTAIRLEDQHSLAGQLLQLGVIPPGGQGPLQLVRDEFVEGVVAGASRVLRAAQPHLEE